MLIIIIAIKVIKQSCKLNLAITKIKQVIWSVISKDIKKKSQPPMLPVQRIHFSIIMFYSLSSLFSSSKSPGMYYSDSELEALFPSILVKKKKKLKSTLKTRDFIENLRDTEQHKPTLMKARKTLRVSEGTGFPFAGSL